MELKTGYSVALITEKEGGEWLAHNPHPRVLRDFFEKSAWVEVLHIERNGRDRVTLINEVADTSFPWLARRFSILDSRVRHQQLTLFME